MWSLIATARSRSRSNSGRRSAARARPPTQPASILASASCSGGSAIARVALRRNSSVVASVAALTLAGSPIGGRGEVARQHLGDVPDLHGRALALEPAGDVEQAAQVAGQHEGRPGARDVGRLVGHHLGRDLGVLDAEGAAEAAADLGGRHLGELEAAHAGEEAARLALHLELAQAGAGVVVGGGDGGRRVDRLHAHDVREEAHQLVAARRQLLRPRAHRRVVGEQLGVVLDQHPAAGARGDDDVVVARERRDDAARQGLGGGAVARVEGGLPAAGLRRRDLDLAARVLEQLDGREADARAEQVDEAGDEERHARLLAHGPRVAAAVLARGRQRARQQDIITAPALHMARRELGVGPRPPEEVAADGAVDGAARVLGDDEPA